MTRDAFARAVKRALLNAGFVNVKQKYLHRTEWGPMHRATAECVCGHRSGFMLFDRGQDAYSAAQEAAREHIALDREIGRWA